MTEQHDSQEHSDLLRLRREKLDTLRSHGVNPYPYSFRKTIHIPELLEQFETVKESEEHVGPEFAIAGRIVSVRIMGKAAFCHVRDEFGQMQVYVQRDRIGEEAFALFKLYDISDWIGARGSAFLTKTGEKSLRASEVVLLSKSVRPLPVVKQQGDEVYDAFTDKESRYRQRYIDLAVNPDVRDIFRTRAKVISAVREFLDGRGYLEVETPALQPLYGGALARPFITHYNALDRTFYMRIADELYLKRLLVGGFEKVYEICKDFRNEGMDRFHNPEFTMLEFYEAYADFSMIMDLSEELFRHVAQRALGTTEVTYQGKTVDFGKPFRRVRFFDLLKEATGKDLLGIPLSELGQIAKEHDVEITREMGEGKILDEMMKTLVRPKLVEPTFIYDYPLSLSPLAKKHRDDPRLVERFQPFALGFELGNAFSELNDPLDQRERFEAQRKLKEAGDEETQPIDKDFLEALDYGMPPTGGMGIGIDRLSMLLTNSDHISEVILFPHSAIKRETERELTQSLMLMLEQAHIEYFSGTFIAPDRKKGKRNQLKSDIIFNFDEEIVAIEVKAINTVDLACTRHLSQILKQLHQNGQRLSLVLVVEHKAYPDALRDQLESSADHGQISFLDKRQFEASIRLMKNGVKWVKGSKSKTLHRPWCRWVHHLSEVERLKENPADRTLKHCSVCAKRHRSAS